MAANKKKKPSSGAAIAFPRVQTSREITPRTFRSAEIAADSGNIRLAVEICEWLLADDRVRGTLDARINNLFGLPVTFEASGDGRRKNRAVKALEADEDFEAIYRESEARQVWSWALLLGIGPGVHDWQELEEQDGRLIPVLRFYHPQPLRYDWQQKTWLARQGDTAIETPIEFGDGTWFGHMPFGTFRPWSLGLWRALAPWVLLKAYARRDLGAVSEAVARDFIEIDKDTKTTKEQRRELANELHNAGKDATIVLPPGYTHSLVELSASTPQLYEKQVAMANEAIAITIRGGNLSTNVEGGSRAAAEVQERQGDMANRRADAVAWSTTTHDQTLVFWAEFNFGDSGLAPWAVYETDEPEDLKQKGDVLVNATTGLKQAVELGFEVDAKAFIDAFGFDFLKQGKNGIAVQPPPPDPNAPAPADPPADPPEPGAAKEGEPPTEGGKPVARLGDLTSGAAAAPWAVAAKPERKGQGYLEGQGFVDALVEHSAADAAALLKPDMVKIASEVAAATDYDDLRTRLAALYENKLDPDELTELVHRAVLLGEFAGRTAVNQDV